MNIKAYAAQNAESPLSPFSIIRRSVLPSDVLIEILYCGVCHSDIHQAKGEWGKTSFPIVPGHEIVGRVAEVGKEVTQFKKGDLAGVGCFIDSCRTCESCQNGLEQYCEGHVVSTYNGTEKDGITPTYGGYSTHIVVDQKYTLKIPQVLAEKGITRIAPLLCAGITTYSPLRHWKVGAGHRVGILGLGGLGHMAVKFAAAFGAQVTVLSTSPKKEKDARALGAHSFVVTQDEKNLEKLNSHFDFIIDTVSAPHDLGTYLNLLKTDGVMILLGVPEKPSVLASPSLIHRRRKIGGSLIGGIAETQEMLDYCAKKEIFSDVEMIPIQKINDAYERTLRGDVHYRFVIDMGSLKG